MRDLTVRLDALDPEAGAALRVITYFDDLVAHGAGLPAIVRGAAILAACPAALVDPGQHIRVRIGAGGVAGKPGPRSPDWPWTPVGEDGELWLERAGEPHPIDAMVLERAAAAIGSIRQSSRGRAGRGRDDVDVATLLDPASSAADRSAAARRLHLSPTTRVRAVASPSGVRIEPADPADAGDGRAGGGRAGDGRAGDGRAGVGPSGILDELPASAVAARLALRLTADGTAGDPGPRVVDARDAGGLLVLASAIDAGTGKHPDVVALETMAGEHPWLLATLVAVAEQSSLRAAAAALHVHHSTLQERIAHAERMLGWSFGDPAGRLRLQLALVLRRLHRTAEDGAGDPAADGY